MKYYILLGLLILSAIGNIYFLIKKPIKPPTLNFSGAQYADTSQNASINYELLNRIDYLKSNSVNVKYINEFKKMEYCIFRHECIFNVNDEYFDEALTDVNLYKNYTEDYINRILKDAIWYVDNRNSVIGSKKENKEIFYIKEYLTN